MDCVPSTNCQQPLQAILPRTERFLLKVRAVNSLAAVVAHPLALAVGYFPAPAVVQENCPHPAIQAHSVDWVWVPLVAEAHSVVMAG